jgi:hypothetical protein
MQTMEAASTEKRLDDLNVRMTEGFGRVHREIDGLDARMTEGFNRLDGDVRELRGEIKALRDKTSGAFAAQKRETAELFAAHKRETAELFAAQKGETAEMFTAQKGETGERFAGVDAHLISINARFDAMHRTMMRGFLALGTINVTLFLAFAGLHGF